jgi:heptosyltransferase-2
MVQRFVALAGDAGAALPHSLPQPELQCTPGAVEITRAKFLGDSSQPLLALCPGAEFGNAKQWPEEHYAGLAANYLSRGWRTVLLGSGNDRSSCTAIANKLADAAAPAKMDNCVNLAGQTNLGEVVNILAAADLVVSNDSGLMHIAAALHRPTVAVYGATSASFTPPLAAQAAVVNIDIDCAPCFQRECPLGHHRCMRELLPQQVIDASEQLLPAALRVYS